MRQCHDILHLVKQEEIHHKIPSSSQNGLYLDILLAPLNNLLIHYKIPSSSSQNGVYLDILLAPLNMLLVSRDTRKGSLVKKPLKTLFLLTTCIITDPRQV